VGNGGSAATTGAICHPRRSNSMNNGKPLAPQPEPPVSATVAPQLGGFAKWLLDNPQALEVWGLLGARLARVECTALEPQSLELDSGDWFLVRVAGLPTTPAVPTSLSGIVRFRRLVGTMPTEESGQETPPA
jgi:hypothetical protein